MKARERIHTVTDHARDALDSGLAIAGNRAKSYADLGAVQLARAREHLPTSFQRPSLTMVLSALGAGLLVGLLLGGRAQTAIGDLTEAGKDAVRRRRLNPLPH